MKYNVKANQISATMDKINESFFNDHAHLLAKQVVDNAPVSSGALRGSITLSADSSTEEFGTLDKSGAITKNKIDSVTINIGEVAYVTAGAPYALYIDQGTSKMAPTGFMRLAVADAQRLADEAARKQ